MAKITPKTEEMDFSDLYEGVKVTVWVNPPLGVLEMLQGPAADTVYEGLVKLVKEWNVEDDNGKIIPITPKSIRDTMPTDLMIAISTRLSDRMTVPNQPTSRQSQE